MPIFPERTTFADWSTDQTEYLVYEEQFDRYYYRITDNIYIIVNQPDFARYVDVHHGTNPRIGWDRAFYEAWRSNPDLWELLSGRWETVRDTVQRFNRSSQRRNSAPQNRRNRRGRGLCIERQRRAQCNVPTCPCMPERTTTPRTTRQAAYAATGTFNYEDLLDAVENLRIREV